MKKERVLVIKSQKDLEDFYALSCEYDEILVSVNVELSDEMREFLISRVDRAY